MRRVPARAGRRGCRGRGVSWYPAGAWSTGAGASHPQHRLVSGSCQSALGCVCVLEIPMDFAATDRHGEAPLVEIAMRTTPVVLVSLALAACGSLRTTPVAL